MTKKTCFMIQPFSDPYNKRFDAIYEPAIKSVGLVPYRAGGPLAEIITEDIENGIRNAHICFADITEDNPNVWYEVGFAYACRKSVVMVCNKTDRGSKKLPFDVRVKNVIFYESRIDSGQSDSGRDFTQEIIKQAKARAKKADSNNIISPAVMRQSKNSNNRLTLLDEKVLKLCFEHHLQPGDILVSIGISRWGIVSKFPDAEQNDVMISFDKIELEGYITKIPGIRLRDIEYVLTEKGRRWCHDNR